MDPVSGWDFTLANYDAVWGFTVQFGLLMMFLVIGNILRRTTSDQNRSAAQNARRLPLTPTKSLKI